MDTTVNDEMNRTAKQHAHWSSTKTDAEGKLPLLNTLTLSSSNTTTCSENTSINRELRWH